MTILLWYFPFIIFWGAYDLVCSVHENHSLVDCSDDAIAKDIVGEFGDH